MYRTLRNTDTPPANAAIAARFEEVARLLAEQGASPFRVMAWRRAAGTLCGLRRPVSAIFDEEGSRGLESLPGIGGSLSRAIRDLLVTGRLGFLERLRGESDPIKLLASMPGIGRVLAERLHDDLGLHTLEDLEAAAHDGRLAALAGFGAKRIAALKDILAMRLGRLPAGAPHTGDEPPIAELLGVDREYRQKAEAGHLRRIAPRRFNPSGEAWLPILHTERGARSYTALYSNTSLAHRLGRTHDWVVLYVDGRAGERQYTVITARHGPMEGRRIVRGREAECDRQAEGLSAPRPAEETPRAGPDAR